MIKKMSFSFVFVATALVAMEHSPDLSDEALAKTEWNEEEFQQLREAHKQEKQHQKDLEEVRRTITMVEEREKKRMRAFNIMKLINKRLEQHGE